MKRITAISVVLCLVLVLTGGCATSPRAHEDVLQAALLIGATAQETAEGAYSAVRHGWNQDSISDYDMEIAADAYRVYLEAHDVYRAAVVAYQVVGAEGNMLRASNELADVVAELVGIAKELGVF